MLLSSRQVAAIKSRVRLAHLALMVELLGDGAVPPRTLREIQKAGLYKRAAQTDIIRKSYIFGRLAISQPDVLAMDDAAFRKWLRAREVVLDDVAKGTVRNLRRSFMHQMQVLGDNLAAKVEEAVLKAEKDLHRLLSRRPRPSIEDKARKDAVAKLAKSLQVVTTQQLGEARRMALAEINNAYQEGRAHEIVVKSGQPDPWVFKRPRPDCCDECRVAYLMEDGKTPRLFRLSALAANGTNVGKSRGERGAVVGSLHPNCNCELNYLHAGFGFNQEGTQVYLGLQKGARYA